MMVWSPGPPDASRHVRAGQARHLIIKQDDVVEPSVQEAERSRPVRRLIDR